jgi:hypothetical protein
MHRSARTVLCGGRPAMAVPTASTCRDSARCRRQAAVWEEPPVGPLLREGDMTKKFILIILVNDVS